MPHPFFDRHQALLQQATEAIATRGYWSAYTEMPSPKVYGETANDEGKGVFVNQSAAFSDFHGTGANPATNASLSDAAFVASRFCVVQSRVHV